MNSTELPGAAAECGPLASPWSKIPPTSAAAVCGRFEARCKCFFKAASCSGHIWLKNGVSWKSTSFSPMIPSTLGKLMFTKMSESYWLLENMQMAAVRVADWMCTSPTWLRTARFQATASKSRTWHWKNLESTDFISAACYFYLLRFWKEMGSNSLTY